MNRETWLEGAVERLTPLFTEADAKIPKVRVTCGWPSTKALSLKSRRIGECWPDEASEDDTREIFISPALVEPAEVLGTLVHELCHACLPSGVGHKAPFKRLGEAVLLEGKPTQMTGGAAFWERVEPLIADMPVYPHAKLNGTNRPKQTTRLLKVECFDCGYVARVTRTWLDDVGAPLCPCNTQPMGEA